MFDFRLGQGVVRPGAGLCAVLVALSLASCGGVSSNTSNAVNSNSTSIVSFTAAPNILASSGSTLLSWVTSNATSCTLSNGTNSNSVSVNGSYTTPTLTATTTYTLSCAGSSGGNQSRSLSVIVSSSIATESAAWANTPYLSGAVHYYCDCGTGADASCVAGDDANSGLDKAHPKRTIANAAALFATLPVDETVALCQGGAFNISSALRIGRVRTAGATYNDLREFSPTLFSSTAKPIINNPLDNVNTFHFEGVLGGVRILNLKLVGNNGALNNANNGFFFYDGAHDVTMGNLELVDFDMAFNSQNGGSSLVSRINLTGSTITGSHRMGYLGAAEYSQVNYNVWEGNGASNTFDHPIYLASNVTTHGFQFVGNYIHGQWGTTCLGTMVNSHGGFDSLQVVNNVVVAEATQTTPGCWGMEFDNMTSNTHPTQYLNSVFSGNTIVNGGNTSFSLSSCPDCIIENNVIIHNWAGSGKGISVATQVNRGQDASNDRNVIRNNTIWFGPNATGTNTGIQIYNEGTGHIVANNTVTSDQASGQLNCYRYDLALTAYAFIDNNHCYASARPYYWETNHGATLAAWKAYAASYGFDAHSPTPSAPGFVAAGTDFTPAVGSVLIGAGTASHTSATDFTGKTRPDPPAIGAYEP